MKSFARSMFIFCALSAPALWSQSVGTITTIAGNGTSGDGGDGGPGSGADLSQHFTAAADNQGNVYIADSQNNRIRKINTAGIITTIAGAGTGLLADGVPAASVSQVNASDVATDASGNLYAALGGVLVKIDTGGTLHFLTALASSFTDTGDGGPAISAQALPQSIALDAAGNIYLCEILSNKIRKIDTNGIITTIAGTGTAGYSGDGGPAIQAQLNLPQGITADPLGNVYFADNALYVRKIDTTGKITTVAGNGQSISINEGVPATSAGMVPTWVAADGGGNIFINDTVRVREVNSSGIINTVAGGITNTSLGDNGPATSASIFGNTAVSMDSAGNLYISQTGMERLRKVFSIGTPAAALPVISANGAINGASFQPGLVIGSWATVQGSNLASGTGTWTITNNYLPVTVNGVTVNVGGEDAYINYVSPSQINFIVPEVHTGSVQVTVKNSAGTSAAVTANVGFFGPAFFSWPNNQVVATTPSFSYVAAAGTFSGITSAPAKPGDTIILWGTGFGPTNPAYPQGQITPTNATYNTSSLPTVTINNVPATVSGAALAPGFAGLYQVAIQVPSSLGAGTWPVVATIGGTSSPSGMMLAVQ